jgi:hypothetical protein
MVPRSFITNIRSGAKLAARSPALARGIAFGGDAGVQAVDFSVDGGKSWRAAALGTDHGSYSFRRWQINFMLPDNGDYVLAVRCTNAKGETQPETANWNPSGYMRNVVEQLAVVAV